MTPEEKAAHKEFYESQLRLITKKAEEGKVTTEKELVPLYIRPSQAEANLKN